MELFEKPEYYRDSYYNAIHIFEEKEIHAVGDLAWANNRNLVCEEQTESGHSHPPSTLCPFIDKIGLKEPISLKEMDQLVQNNFKKEFANYIDSDSFYKGGNGKKVELKLITGIPVCFVFSSDD